MLGFLIPVGGGDSIPLLKDSLVVGRRDECDVTLRFSNVSGRHCELYCKEGFWYVRDLQSSNGTKVNGVRVREKYLAPGTEIAFAKNRYKIEYDVPKSGKPTDPAAGEDVENVDPDHLYQSIFSKSLLERAGLVRGGDEEAPRFSRERDFEEKERYDLEK